MGPKPIRGLRTVHQIIQLFIVQVVFLSSDEQKHDRVIKLRASWYIFIAASVFSTSSFVNAPLRHGIPDTPRSLVISQVDNSKAHQPLLSL